MSKRKRGDSLTGGTGDISPQLMSTSFTQSGADATTTTQFVLPQERLASSTHPSIIEVLKVFYSFGNFNNQVETDNDVRLTLSTKSFGTTATSFENPSIFSEFNRTVRITTSGAWIQYEPFVQDLTDGAGHGVLVATDNIFGQLSSNATSNTNTVRVKILYRFKRVSLAEYVGIVQSQQ